MTEVKHHWSITTAIRFDCRNELNWRPRKISPLNDNKRIRKPVVNSKWQTCHPLLLQISRNCTIYYRTYLSWEHTRTCWSPHWAANVYSLRYPWEISLLLPCRNYLPNKMHSHLYYSYNIQSFTYTQFCSTYFNSMPLNKMLGRCESKNW